MEEKNLERAFAEAVKATRQTLEDKVLLALDGPYRELRDDVHIQPHAVLVYTENNGAVKAVDLTQLPLLYPCTGPGARWSPEDLGKLVVSKARLYRQSCIANEIADADPEAEPVCGVPVLVVPKHPGPYKRVEVTSQVLPGR